VAEGVSYRITRLLARKWNTLGHLKRELQGDDRFKDFVLSHIDGTTNADDLHAVLANATTRCPADSARLCSEIAASAKAALDESREYLHK
jgi:hypothetical protein